MTNPADIYRGRRAYSYIRFSSLAQAGNDSLRRQWNNAVRYAERYGLVLDETTTLRDLAVSAFTGAHRQRGAMNILLAAIDNGHVPPGSVLLVEAVDRISREHPLEAMDLCQRVLRSGMEIHTIEDDWKYSRESILRDGLARLAGKIDAANQYSERLSMRKSESWAAKKAKARSGIAMTSMAPGWLRRVGESYEVIPERGPVVLRIFSETANGIGADTVARRLNADNVPVFDRAGQGIKSTRKANGWRGSYIKKILTNRAVLGEFQPSRTGSRAKNAREADGPVIPDFYPRVEGMTEDLFSRATKARHSRRAPNGRGRGGRRGHQIANLFTGLCVCEQCKGPLHLEPKGVRRPDSKRPRVTDRSYDYLVCDNARRGRGCGDRTHHRYKPIETAILDAVASPLLFEHGALDPAPSAAVQNAETELAAVEREIEELETQVSGLWDELGRKQSTYGRAAIDRVETEIGRRKAQRQKLLEQLAAERGAQPISNHLDAVRALRAASEVDSAEGYEARARLAAALREIIDMIIFTSNRQPAVIVGGGAMTFVVERGKSKKLMFNNGRESVIFTKNGLSDPFPTPAGLDEYIKQKDRTHPDRSINAFRRLSAFFDDKTEK